MPADDPRAVAVGYRLLDGMRESALPSRPGFTLSHPREISIGKEQVAGADAPADFQRGGNPTYLGGADTERGGGFGG